METREYHPGICCDASDFVQKFEGGKKIIDLSLLLADRSPKSPCYIDFWNQHSRMEQVHNPHNFSPSIDHSPILRLVYYRRL